MAHSEQAGPRGMRRGGLAHLLMETGKPSESYQDGQTDTPHTHSHVCTRIHALTSKHRDTRVYTARPETRVRHEGTQGAKFKEAVPLGLMQGQGWP